MELILKFAFILVIALGVISTFQKIWTQWKTNRSIETFPMIAAVVFVVALSCFTYNYVSQRNFENNMDAVYSYFGKDNVYSIGLNEDGELTNVELKDSTYRIKVKDGLVLEAVPIEE